ncbi:hypothetical protein [Saccharopolyspora phatthalungensis]|uniref:Uncharacterized protein n=1 Tax=Saccharopolyspora phatthalungensis TaxID=664693 RepID=A0A840Q7B7_9PSEU|nr:hypothetical protein [Saccharopolyspora phatthalungensis]MBB5155611.1 hypothetical protein [Saccharopolyspora phatthalungensis]
MKSPPPSVRPQEVDRGEVAALVVVHWKTVTPAGTIFSSFTTPSSPNLRWKATQPEAGVSSSSVPTRLNTGGHDESI